MRIKLKVTKGFPPMMDRSFYSEIRRWEKKNVQEIVFKIKEGIFIKVSLDNCLIT